MSDAAPGKFGRLRHTLLHGSGRGLSSAAIWQISNYILPLITFPYLGRVLGVEGFGILGLATAVAGYALLVADWGFSLSATQTAAQIRHEPEALNRLIWSVVSAKLMLGLLATITVFLATFFLIPDEQTRICIYIGLAFGLLTCAGLEWVLRGLEDFKAFATISIVSRAAVIPLLFILVRDPSDLPLSVAITSAGAGMGVLATLALCARKKYISAPSTNFPDILLRIREGFPLFLSSLSINLYTTSLLAILGTFSTTYQVGLFAGADRLRKPVLAIFGPIQMVFFPKLSYFVNNDPERAKTLVGKILLLQGSCALFLTAALFITAPYIVPVILGQAFIEAVPVLRILSLLVFLIGVSGVLGLLIMLPFGLKQEFKYCVLAGAVTGFCMAIPGSWLWGATGIAWAAVLAETAVTISMYAVLRKRLEWFTGFRGAFGPGKAN